ncbi:MAG: cytochrome oxidase maturation protein, cbb3-type [Rubrivivax sp. SCN 71-131]|nr:MAG: cytochrome oxidase maturation protein, cbb3-type [Rubrivivax sp. SCN 71-131]
MSILVVMIPLSIVLLIGAGAAFFWAVEHQQFDDLDTPRILPLLDAPPSPSTAEGATGSAAEADVADAANPAHPMHKREG